MNDVLWSLYRSASVNEVRTTMPQTARNINCIRETHVSGLAEVCMASTSSVGVSVDVVSRHDVTNRDREQRIRDWVAYRSGQSP